VGPAFSPAAAEEWKELVEQVDADLKKVGSSVVACWEVGAAELGRVLIGRPDDAALLTRYSDALVPALAPFQDLHRECAAVMQRGLDAGLRHGRVSAATAPLLGMVSGLGERAGAGWDKTVAFLGPVIAVSRDPAKTTARLQSGRGDLVAACVEAEGVLVARIEALPTAPTLWDGLTGATDAWQLALTRSLELALTRQTRGLVGDVRG
jgi:hypothetical protein